MSQQWSLRNMMLAAVFIFMLVSLFLLVQHEVTVIINPYAIVQQQDSKLHLSAGDSHRDLDEQVKMLGKVTGSRGERMAKKKPPAAASRLHNRDNSRVFITPDQSSKDKGQSKSQQTESIRTIKKKNIQFNHKSGEGKFEIENPAMFPAVDTDHAIIDSTLHTDDAKALPNNEHQFPSSKHTAEEDAAGPASKDTTSSHHLLISSKAPQQQQHQQSALSSSSMEENKNSIQHQLALNIRSEQEHSTIHTPDSTIKFLESQAVSPSEKNLNNKKSTPAEEKEIEEEQYYYYDDGEYDDDNGGGEVDSEENEGKVAAPTTGKAVVVDVVDKKRLEEILDEEEEANEMELTTVDKKEEASKFAAEKLGKLTCNGKSLNSEVIYWMEVPGDNVYESPITPHHGEHHEKFLTFEYDAGGWNNIRMGLECLIVVAHAMGRTLVVPPQEHLYLIRAKHKDAEDSTEHDEMGFEDFFDLDLLRSHKGFHILHMEEFLAREAVTGHLKGILPPQNSSKINHGKLSRYLQKVADMKPAWSHRFLAFPSRPGDFNLTESFRQKAAVKQRMFAFSGNGDRQPIFYDSAYQQAKHIHLPTDPDHRILQHHYAFAFFADPDMQSFYRRFVRDYMRYKDRIQCAGHDLVTAVRAEAWKEAPQWGGEYFAMHIRRGDFQYKDVKISAAQMLKNMKHPNGTAFIPKGALVYISTDDPDGECRHCAVKGKLCKEIPPPKPEGCPEDTTYQAFIDAGFKIRFMKDFIQRGLLTEVNPNTYGMIESIVCSRSKVFVGTFFSTFTGYIHRLRGYHGRGEDSYYHSTRYVHQLQLKKSVGQGWPREWRAGWTDDAGGLI